MTIRKARRTRTVTEQTRVDIGALEQRVYGVEQGLQNILSQIGGLSTKLDERGRPQYSLLISIGGLLLGVIGSLSYTVITPITTDIGRLERGIDRLIDNTVSRREFDERIGALVARVAKNEAAVEKLADTTLPIAVHNEFKARIDQRIDSLRENALRELGRIDGEIGALRGDMVSRSEHQTHWSETSDRINSLSARITDLQHTFGADYTIGDRIKALQTEVAELRHQQAGAPAR